MHFHSKPFLLRYRSDPPLGLELKKSTQHKEHNVQLEGMSQSLKSENGTLQLETLRRASQDAWEGDLQVGRKGRATALPPFSGNSEIGVGVLGCVITIC